jgi:MoxR-like ATPase
VTRHRIDATTAIRAIDFSQLPETRVIEDAGAETVAERDPPVVEVAREPYLPGESLVEAVNLAIALGRPLLLQGDPGCGKTRLAHAVAYLLGLPLEECYIKSTTRAQDLLYTFDAVARLYHAQLGERGPRNRAGDDWLCNDPRHYVRLGPLGRAIARAHHGRRSVVLLDEIDKADLDFPNDLLYELDRLCFYIPEVPGMSFAAGEDPVLRPIVIVTHNEEKALPTAFLRRCIFHYIELPRERDEQREYLRSILALHVREVSDGISNRAADVLWRLQSVDAKLRRKPGLSELIDWVAYLVETDREPEGLEGLPFLGALIKLRDDIEAAREALRRE